MKIRIGFVSNSSSSSFVVLLDGLSEEVKNKIIKLVNKHNDCANDSYLFISNKFVFGDISNHDESGLKSFVSNNVDKDNWGCKC